MAIHLAAFGGLQASRAGAELDWLLGQRLRTRIAWRDGHPEQALRLLDEREVGPAGSFTPQIVVPFVAGASERFLRGEMLRQAEIHDRLGRGDEAARHYRRIVAQWRDSDPEFRPLLDRARGRIAVLDAADRR